jgi:uncharacterized membrane protein YraQ (UPF0718 family)
MTGLVILKILNVFLTIQEEKKNQKATAIGIPVYTPGVGAISVLEGSLSSGMSRGAALAFLVAGPVTTTPAMTAVFVLVMRQTFAI